MRRILVPVIVLAAALTLAGCSSERSGGSSSSGSGSIAAAAPHATIGNATDSSASKTASDLVQREIVTTAHVTIRSKNPATAGDKAAQLAESLGGRVDDRSQTAATHTQRGTASLTLRVPADKVTTALTRLKSLGTELTITMSADDVTTQGQDLDARITALSTSVDRLLALESKATNSATLIEFETAISSRQGELNSLTAQRRYLSDQVAMSTISLRIVAPKLAAATHSASPGSAAGAGFAGFAGFFVGVFLVLSYLLPWLLLVAAVGAVVVIVRRRRHRQLVS
jgi:hypothetical protein